MAQTYIPPHDIYKAAIIKKREDIMDIAKTIDFYIALGRSPEQDIRNFSSQIKNFYRDIRPKMMMTPDGKLYDYSKTIEYMDFFLYAQKFPLSWAMEMMNQLFAFCEEYGITSLRPIGNQNESSLTGVI